MNATTHAHRMSERTARMQTTPAGIRIGIATVPRQRVEITQDADRLQAALLSKPRNKDYLPGVVLGCAAVFLIAGYSMGWLL